MALTVSNKINFVFGNKRGMIADVAFDSSYAFGGETLQPSDFGFSVIEKAEVSPIKGYSFEFDISNTVLKVFAPAPPIVYEEKHTIASNAITTNYPAAAILNVTSATVHQKMVDPSATMAANECQLSAALTAGARATIDFHASTSGVVYVTYITQAWKDVWDNRVASEVQATASHVATLTYNACFIESCHGSHATSDVNIFKPVRGGDAAATGEVEVDYTDAGASSATTLTFLSTDAITGVKATYIKKPSSGFLADRFVEDEDLTITSTAGNTAYPMLFNGFNGQIPDYTAANERDPHASMMLAGDALGTGAECYINWYATGANIGNHVKVNDSSSDAVSMTYVKGVPSEIPGLIPLEVRNGNDLSGLTGVKVMVIGR